MITHMFFVEKEEEYQNFSAEQCTIPGDVYMWAVGFIDSEWIQMPGLLLIVSQSDDLIQVVKQFTNLMTNSLDQVIWLAEN